MCPGIIFYHEEVGGGASSITSARPHTQSMPHTHLRNSFVYNELLLKWTQGKFIIPMKQYHYQITKRHVLYNIKNYT